MPDSVPSACPRESLLLASCAIGFTLALFVPHNVPMQLLDFPPDMDKDVLLDTVAGLRCNSFGTTSGITEALAKALRTMFTEDLPCQEDRWRLYPLGEDAAQIASLTAHFSIGGPTPGLIRHIVETGEIPKEAEIPFDVSLKKEKDALVAEIRAIYSHMDELHSLGPNLDRLADDMEQKADSSDVFSGLSGKWLDILESLLPLWPPEASTANLLLSPKRRDRWLGDIILAADRANERLHKRDERQDERTAFSVDEPVVDSEGNQAPRHETWDRSTAPSIGSPSLARSKPRPDWMPPDLDKGLDRYGFTPRERLVAELLFRRRPQAHIAALLDISAARVSQLKSQVRKKIDQADRKPSEQAPDQQPLGTR